MKNIHRVCKSMFHESLTLKRASKFRNQVDAYLCIINKIINYSESEKWNGEKFKYVVIAKNKIKNSIASIVNDKSFYPFIYSRQVTRLKISIIVNND